jgi:glycosyltransferase involved in cell wall biosynthesis
MRLAHFHTNTILSSWSTLAIPETLRRMGNEVLEGAIPTNQQGAVIHQLGRREFQQAVARMPKWEDLQKCDAILVSGPEYVLVWLNTLYGKEKWCSLNIPRVGFHLETSEREDHNFHYEQLQDWCNIHFYPSPEDATRFKGHYLLGAVDTEMFKPAGVADSQGECEAASGGKKYDVGFVGTLYTKRLEFLARLLPLLDDLDFRAGVVAVRDINGERHRNWAELLVENLQQLRIHVGLPSNNIRMMVSRPLETMASGTFLLTYRTEHDVFRDGEHCRFYNPENPQELADLVHYYLKHESERESIARAGCQEVRQNFSLQNRLAEVLEIVKRNA